MLHKLCSAFTCLGEMLVSLSSIMYDPPGAQDLVYSFDGHKYMLHYIQHASYADAQRQALHACYMHAAYLPDVVGKLLLMY